MTSGQYRKGDVIAGKYEIHSVLGKGGFGVVYLIRMLNTGEAFAMKTFRDERMADLSVQDAFKKEALLWVNLERHPFIVAAQWVEQVSGRLFVLMEHIAADAKGRVSLAEHLAGSDRSLDANQALEWGIQFCLGMKHAQSRSIKCHRDIKPGNILIGQDGTLKISDFGLAVAAQSVWRGSNKQCESAATDGADVGFAGFHFSLIEADGKMRCGTPGYMPPEVYRGEGADIQSDIYSFGLVLWQMVTRNPSPPFAVPWRGDVEGYLKGTYEQQMTRHVPSVEGPIAAVINRCLHPKPQNRYSSFQELCVDLQPLYEQRAGRRFQIPRVGAKTATFWINKGGSLAALGRHDEAIRCYDAALAIDPSAAQIWNNKGSALSALGRSDDAIHCYDQAIGKNPRFAMALDNKARELMVRGNHQEALRCYDRALDAAPQYAEAWQGRGSVLAKSERHEEALKCYDQALVNDSRLANGWHNRGLSLLALNRDVEALESFDRALEINPRLTVALDRKAVALAALERYAEAIPCFEQALALNPENANSWLILAQCRWAVGDIAGQTKALEEVRKRDSGGASEDFFERGFAFYQAGNFEEAARCYDAALAAGGKNSDILTNKGAALMALGRDSEAIACFEEALSLQPENAVAWNNKGDALWRLGRLSESLAAFDTAIELNSGCANSWFGKARVLAKMDRNEEAVAAYKNVARLDPSHEAAWFNMGHCMGLLGRHEDAVECCDRALKINPHDSQIWILKGLGFYCMKRYRDAISCFQQADALGDASAARRIANCRNLLRQKAEKWFERASDSQQAGNNAEAIRCYDAGLAIDASNADVWNNKGAALLALNQGYDAIACFDRALALNPRDSHAWNNKGYALFFMEQYAAALPVLEEAQRLGATRCDSMIAVCRDKLGKR